MKTIIPWMLATAVIMLVFPWLAVTFIKGDGGMAACFILFFAVNPIYAICSGAYAGKNIKKILDITNYHSVILFAWDMAVL